MIISKYVSSVFYLMNRSNLCSRTPRAVLVVCEHGPAYPDLADPGVLLPGSEAASAYHNVGAERPLIHLGRNVARQPRSEVPERGRGSEHVGGDVSKHRNSVLGKCLGIGLTNDNRNMTQALESTNVTILDIFSSCPPLSAVPRVVLHQPTILPKEP